MSMKELEYPFDAGRILANRRKIRKELLSGSESFAEKRIAVLGGSTTSGIVQALELFLLNQGIRPSFYESEYGKYYEDACFGSEALDAFRPDIIYIHTTSRNVTAYPALTDTEEEIHKIRKEIEDGVKTFAQAAQEYSKCPSKAQGGNLGTFGRGQMVPEFDKAVFEGEAGKLIGPVKTTFGYHLIHIDALEQGSVASFEEVYPQIMQQLINEKQNKKYMALRQGLIEKYGLEFKE